MFTETIIDKSPVWLLLLMTFTWLVIGCELGYRLGRLSRVRWPEAGKSSAGAIMGSALGLLAFLLAFTFGMSSSRFDTRKQLVLEEAGSILVTYQRVQSLPEPQRTECSRLLKEYVRGRLSIGKLSSVKEVQDILVRSEEIQDALWDQAASLSRNPNALLSGFMQSLSSMTEFQVKRVRAAAWNRIPTTIIFALYGIAFCALAALGFNSGLTEQRPVFPVVLLVLAFACVIVLIVDLERPQQQLFTVSQEPISDVARRIQVDLP